MKRIIIINVLTWSAVVAMNVWMTKAGAPQQVWLFCDMLGWCR